MRALQAPPTISGIGSVSLEPSSSIKSCMVRFPPLQSPFFGHGVEALKVNSVQSRVRCISHGGVVLGAQMNLFSRLAIIIMPWANAILGYFEDPEEILDQAVAEMNDNLMQMRQAAQEVSACQKQLQSKYEAAEKASNDWRMQSLFKAQHDQLRDVIDNLVSKTKLLEIKVMEANSRKETLKAHATTAKTVKKVHNMIETMKGSNAFSVFEKMEQKVCTF